MRKGGSMWMLWSLAGLLTLGACRGEAQGFDPRDNPRWAKDTFIAVAQVWLMPEARQRAHVASLYRDLFLRLSTRYYSYGAIHTTPAEQWAQRLRAEGPEAVANELGKTRDEFALEETARFLYLDILQKQRALLIPLVRADLRSGEERNLQRGLQAVSKFKLTALFGEVVTVLHKNSRLDIYAVQTLRDLDDPRAIRILVEHDPKNPAHYSEALRSLCKSRPALPALRHALNHEDADIRWRAAYALAESGDPALAPDVIRLTTDPDSRVRQYAANIGFNLKERAYAQVEPHLRTLLTDKETPVRLFVAEALAWRKDKSCAPTLLALAQDETLSEADHSNVIQAINNLAGSYFGYSFGSDGWRPTTAPNREALRRFAAWVRENAETK